MFRIYARGRWAAFLSPRVNARYRYIPRDGAVEHVVSIYHDGTHPTLPVRQSMIGFAADSMWETAEEYVNEMHAADEVTK